MPQDIPEGEVPSAARNDRRAFAAALLLLPEGELTATQRELRDSVAIAVERLRTEGFFDDLETFSRGGPVLWPMSDSLHLHRRIPELPSARALGRLQSVLAERSIRSGDCEEAARHLAVARFLADSVAHLPAALGRLVGVNVDESALGAIEAAAFDTRATMAAACLETLLSVLTPRDHRALARYAFEAERLIMEQAFAFVYIDGPDGRLIDCDRWALLAESSDGKDECLKLRFSGSFNEDFDIALSDGYFSTALRVASQRPGTVPERYGVMQQAFDDLHSNNSRGSVTYIMMPNLRRTLYQLDRHELLEAGVRVRLALAMYRAKHAQYPTRLDDLIPDILPEPVADPYAADSSLRYRRIGEGNDADYLLYSVGLDGQDNQGRSDPENPETALRSPDSDIDWVIHGPASAQPVPQP